MVSNMNHTKPTQEELDASISKVLADLEEPTEDTPPVEVAPRETEPVENPVEDTPPVEEELLTPIPEDVPEDDIPSEKVEDLEDLEPVEDPNDPKKLYQESTREAQRLAEENKKMDLAMHDALNIGDPTDEELRTVYPQWEDMSDTERMLAKDNYINKKKLSIIEKAAGERRTVDAWNEKVDKYTDNPKLYIAVPELEGKQEAFKEYAKDKSRRNVSFSLIVSAFLHDYNKNKKVNRGQMFETGSSRAPEKSKPKSDKLTVEQGRALMHTNYKEYARLLKEGKIANE